MSRQLLLYIITLLMAEQTTFANLMMKRNIIVHYSVWYVCLVEVKVAVLLEVVVMMIDVSP